MFNFHVQSTYSISTARYRIFQFLIYILLGRYLQLLNSSFIIIPNSRLSVLSSSYYFIIAECIFIICKSLISYFSVEIERGKKLDFSARAMKKLRRISRSTLQRLTRQTLQQKDVFFKIITIQYNTIHYIALQRYLQTYFLYALTKICEIQMEYSGSQLYTRIKWRLAMKLHRGQQQRTKAAYGANMRSLFFNAVYGWTVISRLQRF